MYRLMQLALYLQPSDDLWIFANQTGNTDAVLHAIDRLEAAAQSGALDPRTDMHAAWITAVDALVKVMGTEAVTRTLSSFDAPASRYRHVTGPRF